ncbi:MULTISPECIES: fumarylacetoacetate hydrolase family protein [unclassified Rathayibacter]|uniref:fumarylacetoacetate hydrolase family protein n=1 Tax=unclassified Rathayibacter TaxID=2609250 RepID=UPI000F4CC4B2|nr:MULTISPECIES: fumarylacetoacetate hydrolase family protein [unclassified Rathayibacter]ROP49181.1 2-keto-4-pentenoate hydratase/2-oxohepta-3-ene-1,7-dioic acid hydratase in catechol pathway [Rathayibacter sp. PhB186]ROS50702.1 2-keto-4-pentenoate hydratase/2-oxohepta-3-ene-1,7-dioic acid hydratase in catechol pathway [Rathayibacter sp. PhB185]
MRIIRIGAPGAEQPAVEHDGARYSLAGLTTDISGAWLAGGGIAQVRDALAAGTLPPLARGGRLGAPIARPGKIVCIGLNYRDHAEETGAALPVEPVVFLKDPSTIVGPEDDVLIPRGSVKTDWEVELGVVIGHEARYLDDSDDALAYVAGYVLSHDVSEREFQLERGGQWDKGKSCETFNPLGPWLVPAEEVGDPQNLGLRLHVNGNQRQSGSTASMVFSVAHVIRYLSRFMVLNPGDLINTGTPAGVALGLPGTPFLRDGDVVELSIDGLGTARQTFRNA